MRIENISLECKAYRKRVRNEKLRFRLLFSPRPFCSLTAYTSIELLSVSFLNCKWLAEQIDFVEWVDFEYVSW